MVTSHAGSFVLFAAWLPWPAWCSYAGNNIMEIPMNAYPRSRTWMYYRARGDQLQNVKFIADHRGLSSVYVGDFRKLICILVV